MGSFSIWHILILGAAALLLFGGRGKISDFMGDFGKGIKSFKKGLTEEESEKRVSRSNPENQPPAVSAQDAPATLSASVPVQAVGKS
jgi:sec-independent protein translocase protein TatA